MAASRRLPSVTRTLVVECGGNSGGEWGGQGASVQVSYGLVSCSEWTGVLLSTLLAEVGVPLRLGAGIGAAQEFLATAPA